MIRFNQYLNSLIWSGWFISFLTELMYSKGSNLSWNLFSDSSLHFPVSPLSYPAPVPTGGYFVMNPEAFSLLSTSVPRILHCFENVLTSDSLSCFYKLRFFFFFILWSADCIFSHAVDIKSIIIAAILFTLFLSCLHLTLQPNWGDQLLFHKQFLFVI